MEFAFTSIDNIPFTDFLNEHISTVDAGFFRQQEMPEFYVPLIKPWLDAVRDDKVFEQVGCFLNSFPSNSDFDFQFDFD